MYTNNTIERITNKNPSKNTKFLLPLLSASENTMFSQIISSGSTESVTKSSLFENSFSTSLWFLMQQMYLIILFALDSISNSSKTFSLASVCSNVTKM
jgi:hypothetical protein